MGYRMNTGTERKKQKLSDDAKRTILPSLLER